MKTEFEIFVHAQGRKPVVEKVSDDDVLSKVLEGIGLGETAFPDAFVFVDDDGDLEDGADDDTRQPVDCKLTTMALGLREKRYVHVAHCKRVVVEVNFGGKTKQRKVVPARTVAAVAKWARRVFKIDPAIAAEYVLQLCGTTDQPRPDTHMGELTTALTCSVCFDLVKEITPQG